MKRKVVFDTNILILLSQNKIDKTHFAEAFSRDKWLVSIVTRIELLSKPALTAEERRFLERFLSKCKTADLSRGIAAETIRFRSQTRRKLPDAVIAATAVVSKATLISNDPHLSKALYPGLRIETFALPGNSEQ